MKPESESQLLALDIETTGLDPADCRVLAIGLAGEEFDEGKLGGVEFELLAWIEETVLQLPESTVLITWNGEEFDLPFLARRFEENGISTTLEVSPRGAVGKYGKPLFEASWGSHLHVDIAPIYADKALAAGVPWSLKPVARSILGVEPIEVDRRGSAIAALDDDLLRAYVLSDARVTYQLAHRLAREELGVSFLPDIG